MSSGEARPIGQHAAGIAAMKLDTFQKLAKPMLAEFVATACFLFVACGSATATIRWESAGTVQVGIALAFGFTIVSMAFAVGHISGGHLNCAVTFAFVVARKISVTRGICYFISQMLGGLAGLGLLRAVTPSDWDPACMAANRINWIQPGQAFLLEAILTFTLLLVVNAATDSAKGNKVLVPVAIGFAVAIAHMMAIPLTGTSINPSRSFASAVWASDIPGCEDVWDNHWVFWFGPCLGAVVATMLYEYVFLEDESESLESQFQSNDKKKGAAAPRK